MATPTTHRPVGLAPSPWLGWMLVVLAALAASWVVVTVVDIDGSGGARVTQQADAETFRHESSRRPGSTGTQLLGADTAAHAAATARLAGQAEAYSAASSAVVPAPAPSDIFDYRELGSVPGSGLAVTTAELGDKQAQGAVRAAGPAAPSNPTQEMR